VRCSSDFLFGHDILFVKGTLFRSSYHQDQKTMC
jgi:hypothetical protein